MAVELLSRARAAGLDISVDSAGRLRVRGPRRLGALAADVLARRAEIIAILATSAPVPTQSDAAPSHLLDTIAAQHCHPAVLAERLGMPVDQVLMRLERSQWRGHGARIRARLGMASTRDPDRSASPEHHLHRPAR